MPRWFVIGFFCLFGWHFVTNMSEHKPLIADGVFDASRYQSERGGGSSSWWAGN